MSDGNFEGIDTVRTVENNFVAQSVIDGAKSR